MSEISKHTIFQAAKCSGALRLFNPKPRHNMPSGLSRFAEIAAGAKGNLSEIFPPHHPLSRMEIDFKGFSPLGVELFVRRAVRIWDFPRVAATIEHLDEIACPFEKMQAVKKDALSADPSFYDPLIAEFQKRCLDKIEILEEVKIQLRGDAVSDHILEAINSRRIKYDFLGCVRNHKYSLHSYSRKVSMLTALACEIRRRMNLAFYYKEKSGKANPVIMVGHSPFPRDLPFMHNKWPNNSLFEGGGDDIGQFMNNLFIVRIPDDINIFDNYFPERSPRSPGEQKHKYEGIFSSIRWRLTGDINSSLFGSPEQYLNMLILTEYILSRVSQLRET